MQKSILLSAMAAIEAKTGNENSDFLFIGELDSPTLINEIDAFSSDLRQLVRALEGSSAYNRGVGPSIKVSGLAGRLRQYFDEFSRLRKLKGQKPSAADCYHGSVVRAIRDHFDGSVQALKNKEIDLTVVNKKRIFLFEVKTSAQTQSVYTAVGQLAVHALGAVAATFNSKLPLIKVIVLPQQPTERLRKVLTELGICLITFTRSKNGRITIKGLQAVVNGP